MSPTLTKDLSLTIEYRAAFRGMHVSPAKHSFGKCDGQTDRQTDGQTDDGQSDPYVSLCFAGDTKSAYWSYYWVFYCRLVWKWRVLASCWHMLQRIPTPSRTLLMDSAKPQTNSPSPESSKRRCHKRSSSTRRCCHLLRILLMDKTV